MVVKFYAWVQTGSQSILASFIDACLDISSSAINLIAVTIALRPPDDNHRFGHDKFQDLAIFSQSVFFFASSLFILASALLAIYFEEEPKNTNFGINVMYISTFLTLVLVSYQSYVVKKTKSRIIEADKLHYFTDFLTNIAVILSLHLSGNFKYIDSIAGVFIAIYIMRTSYILFRDAIRNLLDEELKEEDRQKIIDIILSFNKTEGFHELKTRSAANKAFIQFHLELDGDLTLNTAHKISDKIHDELKKHFPNSEIIIHQDPSRLKIRKNEV